MQAYTDQELARRDRRRRSPATGLSMEDSWLAEQAQLRPLPLLPEVFDVVVTRKVHGDCTVNFEDRSYSVPFVLVGREVDVRGCSGTVQILHEGRVVTEHARSTAQRVVTRALQNARPSRLSLVTAWASEALRQRLEAVRRALHHPRLPVLLLGGLHLVVCCGSQRQHSGGAGRQLVAVSAAATQCFRALVFAQCCGRRE